MMRSYEDYPVKPDIRATDNAFKITLPNVNEVVGNFSLSANESVVLKLFKDKESITRKDVEAALNISQAMAVRVLKGLVEKKKIQPIGGGRNTRYVAWYT
jgi:ATP-dependent DNA helicase RecG